MSNNNVSDFFSNSIQVVAVDRFFQLLQQELMEKKHTLNEEYAKQEASQLQITQLVEQQRILNEQLEKLNNSAQKKSYLESVNDIKIFKNLAKQGDVDAQNKLASIYYMTAKCLEKEKNTLNRNVFSQIYSLPTSLTYFTKAHKWYGKAAEQNNGLAQYNLGFMYYNGDGVTIDHNEALQWYLKAVANGSLEAHCHLGHMFQERNDYKKAAEWYLAAIELGSKDAEGYYQALQADL